MPTVTVHGQERQAGLQRAVVEHVLEVERAEEERRVHPGDEEAADDARADQAAQAQDAQRHDRVRDPRLEGQEGAHQRDREGPEAEHLGGAPAVAGRLHDRVDGGHQRDGDEHRAEPVDAVLESAAVVGGDQRLAQRDRRGADRKVDEEDPVPVQRLRQRAAGEQAERAAGDGREHVGAHRLGAVAGRRELGHHDGEDHRHRQRAADALDEAGDDQESLAGREAAERRGGREDDDAGEEHALTADQVAEAAGQQQEAAERDQKRVDDPGQVALGEVEVALDRGQRHVHDRRVEDDHELCQADHHEGKPAATVAGCGGESDGVHLRGSQLLRRTEAGAKVEASSRHKRRLPPALYGGRLRFVKRFQEMTP